MEMDPALCVIYLSQRQQEVKSKQLAMEVKANSKAWVVLRPSRVPYVGKMPEEGDVGSDTCSDTGLEQLDVFEASMNTLLKQEQ